MYLCTGFRQEFLPRVLVDTKWIHIVRSMARPRTDNGQTVEYRHQKTKSKNWLAPWYFSMPPPRGEVKHNIMTKIMITLIKLMYYLMLACFFIVLVMALTHPDVSDNVSRLAPH